LETKRFTVRKAGGKAEVKTDKKFRGVEKKTPEGHSAKKKTHRAAEE